MGEKKVLSGDPRIWWSHFYFFSFSINRSFLLFSSKNLFARTTESPSMPSSLFQLSKRCNRATQAKTQRCSCPFLDYFFARNNFHWTVTINQLTQNTNLSDIYSSIFCGWHVLLSMTLASSVTLNKHHYLRIQIIR